MACRPPMAAGCRRRASRIAVRFASWPSRRDRSRYSLCRLERHVVTLARLSRATPRAWARAWSRRIELTLFSLHKAPHVGPFLVLEWHEALVG